MAAIDVWSPEELKGHLYDPKHENESSQARAAFFQTHLLNFNESLQPLNEKTVLREVICYF